MLSLETGYRISARHFMHLCLAVQLNLGSDRCSTITEAERAAVRCNCSDQ